MSWDLRPYAQVLAAVEAADAALADEGALLRHARVLGDRARAGEDLNVLLPECFAVGRRVCAARLGMRPFDVQMMAAVALHQGRLAQLDTGEGKTLVAVLPAVLNALTGRGVHILTANDYLARRDAAWMRPVYEAFGLSVAFVAQGLDPDARRRAYLADVTYVTAKEAGFDFLRDQTAVTPDRVVQRTFHYAIVDEADFILVDEARVPLVIAGLSADPPVDHARVAAVVSRLTAGVDYRADEHARAVSVTDAGLRRLEEALGCGGLHEAGNQLLLSAIHVALHARVLLRRDRDYIVRRDRIELVDEFTGRVADNRRWPHGIQPAVEAREGVPVRPEGRILGSIPIQHFVRLWPRLSGMTATAVASADEFHAFYGLRTVVFPPHRPCRRVDEPDVVFSHRAAKVAALLDEIARVHQAGRPILVGTASVAESEELATALRHRRVKCHVLNARHDAREALIVSRAGTPGAVTISTNMAGRGTDIVLGAGDPEAHARVVALGGLYVIGTNRHESRRIDDQLRGRAGRQGDPGTSRFFVSLEDDLIQRYGVVGLIPRSHRPSRQDGPVDDPVVRREIARAQRIIEGQNFEIRKTLWRYSAMVEQQRQAIAERRLALLGDELEPVACQQGAPEHYEALVRAVGPDEVRRAANQLTLLLLDRRWSDHLALIEDIREGIHLQRYGGRDPLTEFGRQIIAAYGELLEDAHTEAVEWFTRLQVVDGTLDVGRTGLRGPSSTWTYLINDNPFGSFGLSLMAVGNVGVSMASAMIAIQYVPISIAVALVTFLRRWFGRRRRERAEAGGARPPAT